MRVGAAAAVVLALAGCAKQGPAPPTAATTPSPAAEPIAFAVSRAELTQGGWLKGTVSRGIAALTLDGKHVPVSQVV